jgi:transposase
MTTIIILIGLAIIVYVIAKSLKAKKEITPECITEKVEQIKKENEKKSKYPQFIPFYKWHGFLPGLHPQNRRWVLTNGKEGVKPKRWPDL